MKVIKDTCYKGTRILLGDEKRILIDKMIGVLRGMGFVEISMPIIQYEETFEGKVGEENNNMMFNFTDRGDREICLAPEYTAVIQQLAKKHFKPERNVKVFYVQECFRGEKPQAGRYRQFTQLGVEIMNPSRDVSLAELALGLITNYGDTSDYEVNRDVVRGLDYYKDGKGFEIRRKSDDAQICGGGTYDGGIGFAIGIDRLI